MDNTQYLKELAEAEKRAKQTELEQVREAALKKIEAAKTATMPEYAKQKQQVSVQSQLGAKNLAEYWANKGQTNAGISAQAELSRNNTFARSIGDITTSENNALQAFSNQQADTNAIYQNNLVNANNTIDTNLYQNIYNEQVRKQEAAEAERIRLANITADRTTAAYKASLTEKENQLPEGTTFAQNGVAYQVLNGKVVPIKYEVKSTTKDPLTGKTTTQYTAPKQQKYNAQGYWLNKESNPVLVGKDNYQPWFNQYDNKSYIIVKDYPISLDEDGITKAYKDKKITKEQLKTITTSIGI